MTQIKLSDRRKFDGWALHVRGSSKPLHWTICTTRREARAILDQARAGGLLKGLTVVTVKVRVRLDLVSS